MLPRVAVSRADLATTLKLLAKFVRGKVRSGDIVIRRCDDGLEIETAGQVTTLPATGAWPGRVRVPARFLLTIAPRLPAGDSVDLRVKAGRLHVGTISANCIWEDDAGTQIDLPLDPTIVLVLSLAHHYSADEIVRAGKAGLLRAAQERRDRLVLRAADVLRPLGVTPADLVNAVDEAVARLHPVKPGTSG